MFPKYCKKVNQIMETVQVLYVLDSCNFSEAICASLELLIESSPSVEEWHGTWRKGNGFDDREANASDSKWTHDLFETPKGKPRKPNAVQGGR